MPTLKLTLQYQNNLILKDMYSSTDSIFVTVYHLGRRLLQIRLSGITSQVDLMTDLREKLIGYAGKLLTLETRNATQGWTRTSPVLFAA